MLARMEHQGLLAGLSLADPGWREVACLSWAVVILAGAISLSRWRGRAEPQGDAAALGRSTAQVAPAFESPLASVPKDKQLLDDCSKCIAILERHRLTSELSERADEVSSLERQLQHAQKMENVGRLAGGIAHDFNNMLTIIVGAADLMHERVEHDPPLAELVGDVREAARRCADLSRQLLVFSRKHVPLAEVVDVNLQLDATKRLLKHLIGEDVQMEFRPDAARPSVRIDPMHLQQIVMNLVVNARDAMPSGGRIVIEARTVELAADNERRRVGGLYAAIVVSDTGSGIDPGILARIFEPYFTTKASEKGTGLGLSTVCSLVAQAGGFIEVDSTVGQGSEFRVMMPVVPSDEVLMPAVPRTTSGSGTGRVVLVEDDAALRKIIRQALEDRGYSVWEARNGGEAILLAEQHGDSIDIVISDVVMPMMDGVELASRLRAYLPRVRVLLTSGYPADERLAARGGGAFLQKPFSIDSLETAVRALLTNSSELEHQPSPPVEPC